MPRESRLTSRLDTLFDELLSKRSTDAPGILSEISRLLDPAHYPFAQKQITRRLKETPSLSAEAVLRATCVMHLTQVPPLTLVHFLSVSLAGTMSLAQFEMVVGFLFRDSPPLPPQLLYDLTQYTYLERKLLAKRSVELSARLQKVLTPQLLLYLYLLSLRDDLSNENVHLIHLILKICFPALKLRDSSLSISAAEEREIAEAWSNVERSGRPFELPGAPARADRVAAAPLRESASYFLDKYFSDAALRKTPRSPEPDVKPAAGQQAALSSTRPREAAGRAPKGESPAKRPRAQAPRPLPVSPEPAASRWRWPGRYVLPFVLAAVLVLCAVTVGFRLLGPASPAAAGVAPSAGVPSAAVPPPAQKPPPQTTASSGRQAEAPAPSRVVQKGDSLWRIYRSMRKDGSVQAEWPDFLRFTKEHNSLGNPDRIFPGNVLTITTEKK